MRLAILHESWLTHSEVGADEIAVLAVLALHANKQGVCWPTQGLLASILGRSRPWVNKVVSKLVELGLVERTHRVRDDGGDRACLYRLVAPEATTSQGGDTASSDENTPSHGGDSVKTESGTKQETHTAGATDDTKVVQFQATVPAEDWQPTDADLIFAIERFPEADLQAATERFVQRCRAKGYRYHDLSAAWRSWLADDAKGGKFGGRGGGRSSAAQTRFDAWGAVAARHGGRAEHAA